MGQENFHASVQYNDLKGSAAADRHDQRDMSRYLEQQGLIQEGEWLVGIQMWSGEVHGEEQEKPVFVTALVTRGDGYDNVKAAVNSGNPLSVRKIRLEMTLPQFFGLFKRFEICLSSDGLIEQCEISFDDQ